MICMDLLISSFIGFFPLLQVTKQDLSDYISELGAGGGGGRGGAKKELGVLTLAQLKLQFHSSSLAHLQVLLSPSLCRALLRSISCCIALCLLTCRY